MNRISHRLQVLAALAAGVAIFAGCAELKDDIPAPTSSAIAVHAAGWTDTASADFHGKAIEAAGWDMSSCQTCHGPDYSGGTSQVSCETCHSGAGGPENCASCHGSAGSNAPPRDLAGNSATSAPGVGAHAKHVLGGTLGPKVWCYECHTVPTSVSAAGHVDSDLPAEVPMDGPLARTATGGLSPIPVHDAGTLTCANTYCHGNWKFRKSDSPMKFVYVDSVMTGANASPAWTGGAPEAACGTCHARSAGGPRAVRGHRMRHLPLAGRGRRRKNRRQVAPHQREDRRRVRRRDDVLLLSRRAGLARPAREPRRRHVNDGPRGRRARDACRRRSPLVRGLLRRMS